MIFFGCNVMIDVRILEIKPVTVYEDTVYTQLIIVEHASGHKFSVFDPRLLCEPMDTGKLRHLDIKIPICSSIEYTNVTDFYIKPFIDSGGLINPTMDVRGLIEKIIWPVNKEKGFPEAVIDMGIGTLSVMLDKVGDELVFNNKSRLEIYREGDMIFIKDGQLYLHKIS